MAERQNEKLKSKFDENSNIDDIVQQINKENQENDLNNVFPDF